MNTGKRVLLFGSFDPLHEGHLHLFGQASELGETVVVVVAQDSAIRAEKGHEPRVGEVERLARVERAPGVDEAVLGDDAPGEYGLLQQLEFDVIALGYDQVPDDETVHRVLDEMGKGHVQVVRLRPHKPEAYKSSLIE